MRRALVRLALVSVSYVAIGNLTAFADPSDGRPSASMVEQAGSASTSGYVETPAGLFHSSCVHAVADGEMAQKTPCAHPGHLSARAVASPEQPAADAPVPDGWMVAGTGWASNYVRYFHADFWVPQFPLFDGGQLVYLFPGLEDATGSVIFQPVLQYGAGPAGGGHYWGISSWVYQDATHAWHSPLKPSYAGDHLYGSIFASNCSANVCDWTVWTDNVTQGWSTTLKIRSGYQLKWVVGEALEVYHLSGCNELPAGYAISKNIYLQDASGTRMRPQFGMSRWSTLCSVYASVNSIDSWVALHYNGL